MGTGLQSAGLDGGRLERIADHIQRNYIDTQRLAGCQIAINRRGHDHVRAFGCMDLERGRPMREDAIFRLFSMTKQVTAVALMTLYEKGLFQLSDPVSRFIPSWKDLRVWVSGEGEGMVTEALRRPLTFRDLLTHTSGLIYAVGWPDVPVEHPVEKIYRALDVRVASSTDSMVQFVEKIAKAPLVHQPGERWTYGVSIDVCAALVEIISGKPFDRYLRDEIFDPLGMPDTAWFLAPEKADRFCVNYKLGPDLKLHPFEDHPAICDYTHDPVFKAGGGGLISTTADFMRFCAMLRRGGEFGGCRILGPRTLEMMRRNHLPGGRSVAEFTADTTIVGRYTGIGFGLGFGVNQGVVESGTMGGGEFAGAGAASTFFWIDPKEDMSVLFMTQLLPFDAHGLRGELKSLIYASIVD